jgi:hypothetical protein
LSEEKWGFPVIEEVEPMAIEEVAPYDTFQDTLIAPEDPTQPNATPCVNSQQNNFNSSSDMCRDIVDQLFHQEILSRRLDALFDSLSGEPVNRHCPTCCQPFIITWLGHNLLQAMGATTLLVYEVLLFHILLFSIMIDTELYRPLGHFCNILGYLIISLLKIE